MKIDLKICNLSYDRAVINCRKKCIFKDWKSITIIALCKKTNTWKPFYYQLIFRKTHGMQSYMHWKCIKDRTLPLFCFQFICSAYVSSKYSGIISTCFLRLFRKLPKGVSSGAGNHHEKNKGIRYESNSNLWNLSSYDYIVSSRISAIEKYKVDMVVVGTKGSKWVKRSDDW